MCKRINSLILPAFLACLGWATAANSGVCFVVGGDCGELNAIRDIKNCSDLGYSYTSDNCLAPKMKLAGGVCKGNDDVLRYEKCECNPDYYPHSKQAEDAYKYDYSDCCSLNGNICHTRTCKADYEYPAGMTSGIAQDGDTCTDDNGTKSKDYKCTISGYGKIGDSDGGFEVITSGGTAQGYTANCYKPKTCAYYNSNYKENGNSPSNNTGYVTAATYPDIKVGKYGSTIYTTTQSKTCYTLRTATCSDYGMISGCNSGYEGQNATQKKSGSQNITCYTACIKKCDEGFTTSCSSTYCVQSGECYRPATCDDIDHVALSGGSYTGNATISSSSTTQNGYTTPSSTYNGSVTYYPKSGLTISGINPSMTESGNVTLSMNSNTCYWSRPYTCEDYGEYDAPPQYWRVSLGRTIPGTYFNIQCFKKESLCRMGDLLFEADEYEGRQQFDSREICMTAQDFENEVIPGMFTIQNDIPTVEVVMETPDYYSLHALWPDELGSMTVSSPLPSSFEWDNSKQKYIPVPFDPNKITILSLYEAKKVEIPSGRILVTADTEYDLWHRDDQPPLYNMEDTAYLGYGPNAFYREIRLGGDQDYVSQGGFSTSRWDYNCAFPTFGSWTINSGTPAYTVTLPSNSVVNFQLKDANKGRDESPGGPFSNISQYKKNGAWIGLGGVGMGANTKSAITTNYSTMSNSLSSQSCNIGLIFLGRVIYYSTAEEIEQYGID